METITILELHDITVKRFMSALFDKNLEGIDDFDSLYSKYIDLSGLGKEGQLPLYVAIHNLEARLFFMTHWLEGQHKVYSLIKMPHMPSIHYAEQLGHRISWDPLNDTFIDQLNRIEGKEKRKHVELKKIKKELAEMEKAKDHQTVSARNSFVVMLNLLNKEGYKIDREKTDMEELSLMVKSHGEEMDSLRKNAN